MVHPLHVPARSRTKAACCVLLCLLLAVSLLPVRTALAKPPQVQLFDAYAENETQVRVTFAKAGDGYQYRLYRREGAGAFAVIATLDTTEYMDSGLTPGGKYAYRVTTWDGQQESDPSGTSKVWMKLGPELKVVYDPAVVNGKTRVTAYWTDVPDAYGYIVSYAGTGVSDGELQVYSTQTLSCTVEIPPQDERVQMSFVVQPYAVQDNHSYRAQPIFYWLDWLGPGAVNDDAVIWASTDGMFAHIEWWVNLAEPDIQTIQIYRGKYPAAPSELVAVVTDQHECLYVDEEVAPGEAYTYELRVSSVHGITRSGTSTVLILPKPVITYLTGTADTEAKLLRLEVGWQPVAGAETYFVGDYLDDTTGGQANGVPELSAVLTYPLPEGEAWFDVYVGAGRKLGEYTYYGAMAYQSYQYVPGLAKGFVIPDLELHYRDKGWLLEKIPHPRPPEWFRYLMELYFDRAAWPGQQVTEAEFNAFAVRLARGLPLNALQAGIQAALKPEGIAFIMANYGTPPDDAIMQQRTAELKALADQAAAAGNALVMPEPARLESIRRTGLQYADYVAEKAKRLNAPRPTAAPTAVPTVIPTQPPTMPPTVAPTIRPITHLLVTRQPLIIPLPGPTATTLPNVNSGPK